MKISGITINVKSLQESIEFYIQVLGFHYFDVFQTGRGKGAMLSSGSLRIGLAERPEPPYGLLDISFFTEDVNQAVIEMKKKGTKIVLEPHEAGLGKIAQVMDPNGVLIGNAQLNEDFVETGARVDDYEEHVKANKANL